MASFSYLFDISFLSIQGRNSTPRLVSGHSSRGTCDQDTDYGYMLKQGNVNTKGLKNW